MVVVVFANVFNTKAVDYESKKNWAPFVAPESWSCGGFIVTDFVKMDVENIICEFPGLRQAIASFDNF